MPKLYFDHHRATKQLVVETGANEISWAYNLTTVAYPTYGGEVVQVLAANIDNLSITGEVKTYDKMEEIYAWFVHYFMFATQGQGDKSPNDRYVENPVVMDYPHRGWRLSIQPISLPGMRYGRDVVIPTWNLQAHIVDPDPEQHQLALTNATEQVVDYNSPDAQLTEWERRGGGSRGKFKGRMHAGMYRERNPFSDPFAVISKEEEKMFFPQGAPEGLTVQGSGKEAKIPKAAEAMNFEYMKSAVEGMGKQMHGQFQKLMSANQQALTPEGASKPATDGDKKPEESERER